MQLEISSEVILSHLNDFTRYRSGDSSSGVSLAQIKMWLVPQKAEHDVDYDINNGYFDGLIRMSLDELIKRGFIAFSSNEGIEYGEPEMFFLTNKGARHLEDLAVASNAVE